MTPEERSKVQALVDALPRCSQCRALALYEDLADLRLGCEEHNDGAARRLDWHDELTAVIAMLAEPSPVETHVYTGLFRHEYELRASATLNADGRFGPLTDDERKYFGAYLRAYAPSITKTVPTGPGTCEAIATTSLSDWFEGLSGKRVRLTVEVMGEETKP